MANVPYDNTQVSPDSTPNVRVNTDRPIEDFGGGNVLNAPAKAVEGLNSDVEAIAEKSFQAAQAASKMNHQNNANTVGLHGLYGTKDASGNFIPGVLQKIAGAGKNAHAVYDEYMEQYSKLANQQIATAKNKDEADQIKNIYADKQTEMEKIIQPHIASEMQLYEKGAKDGSVSGFTDTAVGAYAHHDIVEDNVQKTIKSMDEYAATHGGVDSPQNIQAKSDAVSKLYQGVVEKYFNNGQDVQGKDYYDSVKDKVTDAKTSNALDKLVRDGTMKGNAQRISNQLVDQYNDKAALNEAINGIKDPELQDAVRSKAEPQLNIKLQKTQIEKNNNFLEAQEIAAKQGFDQIPLSKLSMIGPKEQSALKAISNNASGAIPIKNNSKVFNDYMALSPQELAKVDQVEVASEVRSQLDDYHFQQFQEKWQNSQAGIGGDQSALAKVNNVQGNQDAMVQAFSDARIAGAQPGYGLNHINTSPKMRVEFNKFREYVQQEIDAEQAKKKGEALTPVEVKAISNRVAMRNVTVTVPGTLYGTNDVTKNISQLSPEEKRNFTIPITSISDSDKQAIYRAGVLSGGIPSTMSPADAQVKYKSNYEKAAAAAAMGASSSEINAIMGNQ